MVIGISNIVPDAVHKVIFKFGTGVETSSILTTRAMS